MVKCFLKETCLSAHLLTGFPFYAKCIKSLLYFQYNGSRYTFERKVDNIKVCTPVLLEITITNYFLQIYIHNILCQATETA